MLFVFDTIFIVGESTQETSASISQKALELGRLSNFPEHSPVKLNWKRFPTVSEL